MIATHQTILDRPEKRQLIKKMRAHLEPFDFEPRPPNDNVVRVQRPLITLDNGEQYEGEWDELGRKDGKGIQTFLDGSYFEGYWKEDKRIGQGRLIYDNGEVYIAYYEENGGIYEGQYRDGKKHG